MLAHLENCAGLSRNARLKWIGTRAHAVRFGRLKNWIKQSTPEVRLIATNGFLLLAKRTRTRPNNGDGGSL